MSKYFIIFSLILFAFSCTHQRKQTEENIFYTCSMHPQVMEKKSGNCPICGMKLIEVTKNKSDRYSIKLSREQILLANIQTDTVSIRKISNGITLTGTMTVNQNNNFSINSKVSGRIEKLYIKSIGEEIQTGQLLYELYSEELISTQKEYFAALQKQKLLKDKDVNYVQFVEGVKNKLLLWGLTEQQLKKTENGEVKNTVSVYASQKGTVVNVLVKEGDYVMEGGTLFQLTDLSSVWMEAQLYPNETAYLNDNMDAEIIVAAFPNKIIKSKINFVKPELQSNSKIILVRAEIENPKLLYKPGMLAELTLTANQKTTVVIPVGALLRDVERAIVWIQTEANTFEKRQVVTGIENKNFVEIKSGLRVGERVVISGCYLLNSEHIFKSEGHSM